MPLRNIFEDTE